MKTISIIAVLACWPLLGRAQDSINPYVIHQHGNILLQNTDVYYNPFDPPASTDTRAELSNEAGMLGDSNGIYPVIWGDPWGGYVPMTHGVYLQDWAPHGVTLGKYAVWQRLFQALPKADGTPTDIIAGGGAPGTRVIISKNEDVDFRASGRVILKSGFHARAGCFFHAYTDPHWDTAVFSDEFDDMAKFRSQWHISNGWGGNNGYPEGAQCTYDSNVALVTDPDAHDGHAVDIMIREDTDTCNCFVLDSKNNCGNYAHIPLDTQKFIFSSGLIRSCPFPFTQRTDTPFTAAYTHAPYGKYEIREKIPHVIHHTNNWGWGGYGFEWDLNETPDHTLDHVNPNFNHKLWRGPYKGIFSRAHDTVIFISSAAQWCPSNNPESLVIDNIAYKVDTLPGHGWETVCGYSDNGLLRYPDWPESILTNTDSVSFYYSIQYAYADTLPWRVDSDEYGKWRIFTAAYHDSAGHLLRFHKWNQPTSVTLTTSGPPHDTTKTFACHWDSSINYPIDSGKLYLDDTMSPSDLHNGNEAYGFQPWDLYKGPGYPVPPFPFNGDDTTGHYEYHTFAMELLPHEARILIDSVVVRRIPDRLIPPGNPYYDWVSTLPRTPIDIMPAETDMDWNGNSVDSGERAYFEHAASVELANPSPGWPGFEMVDGKPAAHHLVDYIKVWDVPKDVYIPNLPH